MSTITIAARAGAAVIAALAGLGATGCEATLTPPHAVITYDTGDYLVRGGWLPEDIWAYPHVWYGGTQVYLYEGRWYYPTAQGWMLMRREPVELGRVRTRIYASPQYRTPAAPYGNPRYRAPEYGYPQEPYRYRRPPPPQPPYEYAPRSRTPE